MKTVEVPHVPKSEIRDAERESIREFVAQRSGALIGRVLDYGCGDQKYRALVQGEYVPWDREPLEGGGFKYPRIDGRFDAILCTQVLQFIPHPLDLLARFRGLLNPGGYLLMTYPTCWDEVEGHDLFRFTRSGMSTLLKAAGFEEVVHEKRAQVYFTEGSFAFPLGYGVLARRPKREDL